jgi:hypothetical protein
MIVSAFGRSRPAADALRMSERSGVFLCRDSAYNNAQKPLTLSLVPLCELNGEALRRCLQRMPETELLLFGQAAKYICSHEANYWPPCEVPILQLREARAEWRRRHPGLALNVGPWRG